MLKQQARLFTKLAVAVDTAVIVTAFVLAFYAVHTATGRLSDFRDYSWVLVVVIPVWIFLLTYFGLYGSLRTKSFSAVIAALLKVHAIGGLVVSSCVFLVHATNYSRLLFAGFIVFSLTLMIVAKGGITLLLKYFRSKGYNSRNILMVGSGSKIQPFVDTIHSHGDWGLNIIGILGLADDPSAGNISGCPYLGQIDRIVEICKERSIDEVVFSLPSEHLSFVDEYLVGLQEMGITVRMVVDLYDSPSSRKELAMFHGDIPILTYHSKAFDSGQLFLKRCLDILGALVGLIFTAALFPFIATAIRFESPGPLFFGQKRVGENGRTFICWKFRSMFADAEEQKQELMAHNEMNGAMFKMKNDPRVTRVGRFIRTTSLDELPQFWNVLKGEMSLVGTRPPTPDEVATYENWHRKRICIKPGITGLWQVSGRNQVQDFDDVVRLDIRYIEEWSLWLDIKLLFRTIWVVVAGKGAR
ncbi:MAG: sugar transferase [Geobacteraceae bacterium]|nr:sugar transferase [Geobacteraceae bacterium]